jgi:hypothetical protein
MSFATSIFIAVARLECCDRSFWHWTTMPVGKVRDPDGRVGLVDVLPAGAARAKRVHADLGGVDGDVLVVLRQVRDHVDGCERGLPPAFGVERRDPHEPMDSSF